MAVIVSGTNFAGQLARALAPCGDAPLVLHTDLVPLGILDRVRPREEMLAAYLDAIHGAAGRRPMLFPTFNYEYCRTGVYDVLGDPCEVGVLNEYVRMRHPDRRTRTPVFNFCVLGDGGFGLEPSNNPFDADSTFGEMVRRRAWVGFFGASLASNTFVHHVEEVLDVGYRYLKPFPGRIVMGHEQRPFELHYRVQPLTGEVTYDWPRLEQELIQAGVLRVAELGRGRMLLFRADELAECWVERLRRDELHLLTPASRKAVGVLFEKHGRPLRFEAVEARPSS